LRGTETWGVGRGAQVFNAPKDHEMTTRPMSTSLVFGGELRSAKRSSMPYAGCPHHRNPSSHSYGSYHCRNRSLCSRDFALSVRFHNCKKLKPGQHLDARFCPHSLVVLVAQPQHSPVPLSDKSRGPPNTHGHCNLKSRIKRKWLPQ